MLGGHVAAAPAAIGGGWLVLVVGPSGAGKDTLIAAARTSFAGDPSIVFPRRVVTREPSAHEDHDSLSEEAFDAAEASGAFALAWRAHGLRYALPRVMDDDIRYGRTVICNASRTIIGSARRRYAQVLAVLVTAPPETLAVRLRQRGRESSSALVARIERSKDIGADDAPDVVVDNGGDPAHATEQFLSIIRPIGRILSA